MRKRSKLTNVNGGYDVELEGRERPVWWQHPRFPLVPFWEVRQGNEYNPPDFVFSWLNLRVWSLSAIALSIEPIIDGQGVRLQALLLYLRVVIWFIPFPEGWDQKLWRVPVSQGVERSLDCCSDCVEVSEVERDQLLAMEQMARYQMMVETMVVALIKHIDQTTGCNPFEAAWVAAKLIDDARTGTSDTELFEVLAIVRNERETSGDDEVIRRLYATLQKPDPTNN